MSASTILIALAIGVLSGVVAALCGVGGGVVMVPAFVTLLGLEHKVAVATSLAIIIPTALTATIQNSQNNLVHWKFAAITAISAATFAYFGAGWLKSFSNERLSQIFGVVLIVFGLRMLLQSRG